MSSSPVLCSSSSLPTPPGTSRRSDKENHFPNASTPGSRVAWSQHNQYHNFTNSPSSKVLVAISSTTVPTKSILKKSAHVLLTVPESNERETTPEPDDPLGTLNYLESPVLKVVAADAALRDLIESYSILTARIRASVPAETDVDASWPLFQPLRKHRDAFVAAMVRDLGRATVDPCVAETEEEPETCVEEAVMLPSPKNSPRKKKGMSAEQAKYARDLCTTCHSVMKFLALVFTLPAVYRVFSDEQLSAITTQILAIPLASELPTPNARKTCALSIWLLQTQRLPSEVLEPARGRIAYALRRGVEGELGKEGKKGSASDGLKAIHDLSVYQPTTFIPPFTELLPTILSNLLAGSLALRNQAAHALGGFAIGSVALPLSPLRARIASTVAAFLTTPTPSTPRKKTVISHDPAIIRTLRTTLANLEPQHAAQGPIWALSVLASCIVLLGSALCTDGPLMRTVSALLALGLRHKRSSVRALGCLVWRCVTWAYLQPELPSSDEGESEVDAKMKGDKKSKEAVREAWWKLVRSVVDMGTGVATVAALLGEGSEDTFTRDADDNLRRVIAVVRLMIKKGGQTCGDAMEIVKTLVSPPTAPLPEWTMSKLLPPSLFSANPGLLTAEWKLLVPVVKSIFESCPQLDDIRPLPREELTKDWVLEELVGLWREGLTCVQMPQDGEAPTEIVDIWSGLLKAKVTALQRDRDEDGIIKLAVHAIDNLIAIIEDTNLDLTTATSSSSDSTPTSPVKPSSRVCLRSNAALKVFLVRNLWSATRSAIPRSLMSAAGEKLLSTLAHHKSQLVSEAGDEMVTARHAWAGLCAEVGVVCDVDEVKAFWGMAATKESYFRDWSQEERSAVWTSFVEAWRADVEGGWEGSVALLEAPFADPTAGEMDDATFSTWDSFLQYTLSKALDYGIEASVILDRLAYTASVSHITPAFESATRIADALLTSLEIAEARQLPSDVLDFVNDTLVGMYPPEPRNKIQSCWMLRAVTRVIDVCPGLLRLELLQTIQEGLGIWIAEESRIFTQDEYSFDILPLYQTALVGIGMLPRSIHILDTLSPLIQSAFNGRDDKPEALSQAFADLWQMYGNMPKPEEGWPEWIQLCLDTLYPSTIMPTQENVLKTDDGDDGTYDADVSLDELVNIEGEMEEVNSDGGLLFPESEEESSPKPAKPTLEVSDNTDRSSFLRRLSPLFTSRKHSEAPAPSIALFELPSTPTKTGSPSALSSTPTRPRKSTVTSHPFSPQSPPSSPSQHSIPKHERTSFTVSPKTPLRKRTRSSVSGNKENTSPFASFTDRIIKVSPALTDKFSPLGKRRAAQEWQEGNVLKKVKSTPQVDPHSEDERQIASLLTAALPDLSSAWKHSKSDQSSLEPSSRKRKRVFMDAVELPTLRDVQRSWKRLKSRASLDSALPGITTPPKRSRSLKRSVTEPLAACAIELAKDPIRGGFTSRESVAHVESVARGLFSSPSSALEDLEVAGSDDSIMLDQPSQRKELLSDDDLHLGQVTPHHLVSPALRRVRDFDHDPPSDDSNMSASPTRDVAARRLERSSSLSYMKPSPFSFRSRLFSSISVSFASERSS